MPAVAGPLLHLLGQLNGDPLGGAVVGDADEHNEPAGSVDQRGDLALSALAHDEVGWPEVEAVGGW
ncbi:hypothetical protein [Frankia sp. Cas3]|uniref:hypothetical protein n=1 Tax=Frankia sp. Cas3 TaxID=3073926 RepID=UPI002AD50160|nr:hypothetical protein [Frankia sp. Cas3]